MKTQRHILHIGWTLIAAFAATAPLAHAVDDASNPRHPSYFERRANVENPWKGAAHVETIPYVDQHNPRHPAHYRSGAELDLKSGTGAGVYVDLHNPLDPRYGVR
jgi:hypothetical protein